MTTWRDLLRMLTVNPAERERVAAALGVHPYTITRWIEGLSQPRPQYLSKLPDLFPDYRQALTEQLQIELFPGLPPPAAEHPSSEFPTEILARVLDAYATITGPFRQWQIRHLVLERAVERLDPDRVGIEVSVVVCVPPVGDAPVRSLCEILAVGTPPWQTGIERRLFFLGAESLCGWTVGSGQPGVVQDIHKPGTLPLLRSQHEQSAATWPLQRKGKLAGCLLVVSTQVEYFSRSLLAAIEIVANALALSFEEHEFYEISRIALREISPTHQQTDLAHFRQRVTQLRRVQDYSLSIAEAEKRVFQQIESELFTLSDRSEEEKPR
jgi:GAF domain-containing protein